MAEPALADLTIEAPAAGLPTEPALFDFLVSLRDVGFRVDPRQMTAATRLLAAARGADGGTTLAQLMYRLAAVIATSPGEQEDFYRHFRAWRSMAAVPTKRAEPRRDGAATDVARRDPRRWVRGIAVAILVIVALLVTPWNRVDVPLEDVPPETPPTVDIGDPTILGEPTPLPRTEFRIRTEEVPAWYPALLWLLVGAPGVALLAWAALRWRRRQLWLTRGPVSDGGALGRVRLPVGVGVDLYASPRLRAAAHDLRRHRYRPTRAIDVVRTVEATARQAGYFSPVYRLRPHLPDYVFLVEEVGANDHVARLFDVAIDRFRGEGVEIERYYFRTDPRVVHRDDPDRTPMALADLAARTADHRLIVVATADGFFHPITGEPEGWIERFDTWTPRVLLSTRQVGPVVAWTVAELRLLEEGFSLATVHVPGLDAVAEKVGRGWAPDAEILVPGLPPGRSATPPPTAPPLPLLPPLSVFRDLKAPWCPEMVVIPEGSFLMGSAEGEKDSYDDERPQHRVDIGYRFAIGRYPVTFEEYDRFCAETKREKPKDQGWGRGRRPVINVSWEDARAYAEWLSGATGQRYRLPSEAEWEYACRAGTTTRYSWGDAISPDNANYDGKVGKTTEVGTYAANPWGLYDLHGNLWELCEDVWHDSYDGAPADGSAWIVGGDQRRRVLRGGSWLIDPGSVRSADRYWGNPGIRSNYFGFRVARTF